MIESATYNSEEFTAFLHAERECIDKDKWLEGERVHNDPGQPYIMQWVTENSQEFRDKWNDSCCKDCSQALNCGHYLRRHCLKFNKREKH